MFRWGVMSTALIGRAHVVPSLADSENGVVAAVASRDEGRARAMADRFGAAHAFGTYEAMLASDTIDGVYIPLPTSQHVEWSIKAAEAGKHVLCEKPIAAHAGEIDELIAVRDRTGVMISEAFMVTYHPQWHKVRDLIANGAIGTLRHVQGAFTYHLLDPDNMRNIPDLGGGVLKDIGVYPTVSTRFSTGKEPQRISARVDYSKEFGTDIYANVQADFGDFLLTFYCSTQLALRQEMFFHGNKGWISVTGPFNAGDYGFAKVTLNNQDRDEVTSYRFQGVRQYKLQAEAFVRAVRGEATGEVFTLEASRRNQAAIDAMFKAGKSGSWEDV